jgi:hypothetical protein
MTNVRRLLTALACAALAAGCASSRGAGDDETAATTQGGGMNGLTAAERRDGWRLLFDGRSTDAWRGYREQAMPAGWRVVDGTLTKSEPTNDIVTREEFGDFDLRFDWKLGRGGNAGVFYRATEEYDKIYWSATEYQLLDDPNHPDGRSPLTSAGAAYGFYPAPRGVVKPADEWNSSRVVVRGRHVEHWLNGQKIVEYDFGSPDWEAKYQASKFKGYPNYGRVARGRIGIQGDHGGMLALRDIRIRELR